MSKKKCDVCGTVLKKGQDRCIGCGMPQLNLNKLAKGEFKNFNEESLNKPLNDKTLFILERLDLFAKLIKILTFFTMIGVAIYSLFTFKWLLLIGCAIFYFMLPFVALPITWMQLMLENLYEIRIRTK